MELLEHFLPDASTLNLKRWDMDAESHQMVVIVCFTQAVACCPLCQCIELTERAQIQAHVSPELGVFCQHR